MLKINLSNKEGKNGAEEFEETSTQPVTDRGYQSAPEVQVSEIQDIQSSGKQRLLLVLLGILVLLTIIYFQKDRILGLFVGKQELVEVVVPPPQPPPPQPTPETPPKEPDPTFVALNRIGEIIPMKVWLSAAIVGYDGTYEIKGIAFSHAAMGSMVTSLGKIGKVTSQQIPKELKSTETVYNFSINGVLGNIQILEILDSIPTDKLVSMADTVRSVSGQYGIKINRFPKKGETYSDKEMPFVVEGSYEGLKKIIHFLCPEGSDIKVYRLTIIPASPGVSFDKIRASFSLRTVSSI